MRVLVTGSHGFIGSQLVLALKERGDTVFECDFDRMDEDHGPLYFDDALNWPKSYFFRNPKNKDEYLDEIYHLACVNQEAAVYDNERNLRVNALAAQKWAGIARDFGARFVYTSTASVYGNSDYIPTPSYRRENPKSDYAVAKLAGEHFVLNSGADFTIFRLSNVYGPGQTTDNPYCGVVAKFFESKMTENTFRTIGDGSQTRDFTYVEDILPHLMNPELKGVLNCSHGKEISVNEVAASISVVVDGLGPRPTYIHLPERPVDGIQRRCLISDVTCPTDLQTGLQKTYDWILAQNSAVSDSSSRKALL
jgi:UDP-glucose 4-epimerase